MLVSFDVSSHQMPKIIARLQDLRAEIQAVTEAWADSFNKRQAASLAILYDRDAVLWGTLSPEIVSTPQGIRQYFDAVCASPMALRVSFDEQFIRSCGDAMLNSGRYTFTYVQDGREQSFAARFSMALKKKDGQWLILDHHSSARPEPLTASAQ